MINPNELMIGNWVIMPFSPKPQQVKSIQWKEMDSGEFDWYISGDDNFPRYYEQVRPIPLTPELLTTKIKGFEISPKNQSIDIGKLTIMLPNEWHPKGRIYFNSWAIMESIPEHLHTLQNLVKLLTSKELEVNF